MFCFGRYRKFSFFVVVSVSVLFSVFIGDKAEASEDSPSQNCLPNLIASFSKQLETASPPFVLSPEAYRSLNEDSAEDTVSVTQILSFIQLLSHGFNEDQALDLLKRKVLMQTIICYVNLKKGDASQAYLAIIDQQPSVPSLEKTEITNNEVSQETVEDYLVFLLKPVSQEGLGLDAEKATALASEFEEGSLDFARSLQSEGITGREAYLVLESLYPSDLESFLTVYRIVGDADEAVEAVQDDDIENVAYYAFLRQPTHEGGLGIDYDYQATVLASNSEEGSLDFARSLQDEGITGDEAYSVLESLYPKDLESFLTVYRIVGDVNEAVEAVQDDDIENVAYYAFLRQPTHEGGLGIDYDYQATVLASNSEEGSLDFARSLQDEGITGDEAYSVLESLYPKDLESFLTVYRIVGDADEAVQAVQDDDIENVAYYAFLRQPTHEGGLGLDAEKATALASEFEEGSLDFARSLRDEGITGDEAYSVLESLYPKDLEGFLKAYRLVGDVDEAVEVVQSAWNSE